MDAQQGTRVLVAPDLLREWPDGTVEQQRRALMVAVVGAIGVTIGPLNCIGVPACSDQLGFSHHPVRQELGGRQQPNS